MKKNVIALILFQLGLSVFLYPRVLSEVSDIVFVREIREYEGNLKELSEAGVESQLKEVYEYNEKLKLSVSYKNDPFNTSAYNSKSDISFLDKDDVFGYLEIPKLGEKLPIYMGASSEHLANGVAQIENTSLPAGGPDTHSVLAGHRGYSTSTMFRYIDQLEKGDAFYVNVLGKQLKYEVVGQEVILPDQIEKLNIYPGEDRVTLLSCHPYPYNSHRILVYGRRVEQDETALVTKIQKEQEADVIADKSANKLIVGLGISILVGIAVMLIMNAIKVKKR